ncbi:MAG: DUF4962 domain-containing protein [Armatimonadota bacterium]
MLVAFVCVLIPATVWGQTLLPLDDRSYYPHYLNFRPGDGQVCEMNPPRMSWGYVPEVVVDEHVPVNTFTLQLSKTGNFDAPDLQIQDTPYNFYNALPVLEDTQWHWRVGYNVGTDREEWSEVRTFTFIEDAVEWDRTIINMAAQILGGRSHPRLAPPGGDWQAWAEELREDEQYAEWLDQIIQRADATTGRDWWNDFPKTDKKDETGLTGNDWSKIVWELAQVALAYRITGDEKYLPGKDLVLKLSAFEKGGQSSPEYHADVRKWPTKINSYLANCYDWWYPELTQSERRQVAEAIRWRLHATYMQAKSWKHGGDHIDWRGVAVYPASHPFENFVWSMPGVLLTAGDLPLSDELVPLTLNYLTGVTGGHGPDEGWNEGLSYGGWKGFSMLQAALTTQLLLPELNLQKSTYFPRLGEWYAHLFPLGVEHLSFGDYAVAPEGKRGTQLQIFKYLAFITDDGRTTNRYRALAEDFGNRLSSRPWLDLFGKQRLGMPEPVPYEPNALFPEAGWVMVNSRPPSSREAFQEAVGMVFKCRPRGGYSHSFRSENDFVWHAYGATLTASGGSTQYPDPFSRSTMSHNCVLINGEGQNWNHRDPAYPYCGRILAYEEGDDYIHWVGDATHAYQTIPELLRWHRHVVYVDNRYFVMFDDLAMRPDADPVQFSWLYHIWDETELNTDGATFTYTLKDVNAIVAMGNDPAELTIQDMEGMDMFQNPVTGENMEEYTLHRLGAKGRDLAERHVMDHNIWVTNTDPARQYQFLTVLAAHPSGEPAPEISFEGTTAATVAWPDGDEKTVAFDSLLEADISIDVGAVRQHAIETEPEMPPAENEQ